MPDDELLIGRIDLRLASRSLLQGYPEIASLHIEAPELRLRRSAAGRLSIQDLLDRFLGHPSAAPPMPLVLHDLLVRDGKLSWQDEVHGSRHRVDGLQFELPAFSTRPADADQPIEPRLYAQLDGRLLVLYATTRAAGRRNDLSVHFEVTDLRLPEYTDLLPTPAGLALFDGRFDARMDLHLQLREHALPGVTANGTLTLRDVDLRADARASAPLLTLGALELPVRSADLDQRSIQLGAVGVQGFALHAARDAAGKIDWVAVVRRVQAAAAAGSPGPAGPAGATGPTGPADATGPTGATAKDVLRPWQLALDGLDFQHGSFEWRDAALAEPLRMAIRDASLTLGPLQWPGNAPVGFALTLHGDRAESAYLGGLARLGSPSVDAEARLEQIDPDRFSAYYATRLPVQVQAAPFTTRARVVAGLEGSQPFGRIEGLEFSLPRVRVSSREGQKLLVSLQGLQIHGLAADSRQGAVTLDQLGWEQLTAPLPGGLEARSGAVRLAGLSADGRADWRAGHYQLASLTAQDLQVPGQLSATILTGAGLDLDLASRRHQLKSLAAAQLATSGGLRAAAIQCSDASADLAAGHYRAGLLNAAGLEAPGDNRIEGLSLRDSDIDLQQGHYTLAELTGTGVALGGRLRLPSLEAGQAEIDITSRRARLGKLIARGPQLDLLRTRDGKFSSGTLLRVLDAIPRPSPGAAPAGSASATIPQGGVGRAGDWHAKVGEIRIDEGSGSLRDESLAHPAEVHWSALAIHLTGVGTRLSRSSGIEASVRLNQDTRLAVRGDLALDPLQGKLQLDLDQARPADWLSWLPPKLPLTPSGGTLDLAGSLELRGRLNAPALLWNGQARVAGVTLLDHPGGERLLAWDSLQLQGMRINSAPTDAAVDAVVIDGLHAQLQLLADGSFNLSRALAAGQDSAPAPRATLSGATGPASAAAGVPSAGAPASPADAQLAAAHPLTAFPLAIGRIELRNGGIDFSDHFVRPEYSAHLVRLEGSIKGLSSQSPKPGQLELAGQLDGGASVRVSGDLNPLRLPLALDLKAVVRGFELGPLSSYSTRFTGFPIVRGKLSFDVGYHLHGGTITASNQLTLDQLTLGPRQDVRGIRQLPMDLAVNLLKDGDGVIQVDLPIQGTLSDPQFSLGNIIGQLVTRAVERAVTAPFRWLGSLFGGEHAENLGWIGFAPGSDALDATALDKLQHLAAALHAKPALRLDITAHGDVALDAQGLTEDLFHQTLLVQKIQRMIVAGTPVGPPEDIQWSADEAPGLLLAAWQQAHPGRTAPGDAQQLEQDLRAGLRSDADALADLAARRARAAQDWLTGSGGIDPARVFLVGHPDQDSSLPALASGALAPPAARIEFSVR